MNGPQHYAKAEELLANVDVLAQQIQGKYLNPVEIAVNQVAFESGIGAAQVHATLALVAAQVDAAGLGVFEIAATGASGLTAWGKATGVES